MLMIRFRLTILDEQGTEEVVTRLEILYLPPSLMRVSMAPLFLMLSERVLMNCLVDLMPYASQTRVSWPQKNCAMVEPSSTAGVSEKMVSVTASGDVENRISRLQVLFDVILGVWSSSMPGGDIESVLDAGWGCPCKEWA